ncbi:MAG TPA: PIN domain-containing protein [Deinococcales bacterium]|nr:PIN domain-containing protein [Deinococcales bacterium]
MLVGTPRDPVLLVLRTALIALGGLIGYYAGWRLDLDPLNTIYFTLLGILVFSLLTRRPARALRRWVAGTAQAILNLPPEAALAATLGGILALVISVLLNSILVQVPGFAWYHSLGMTAVLATFFIALGLRYQALLAPLSRQARSEARPAVLVPASAKLLDTSVIIDGRVMDVAETGFLEGPLIVPAFVLRELQLLADQSDPLKRARGRRGLELLERAQANPLAKLVVTEFPDTGGGVDDRLARAALDSHATLVTNDSALGRIASLQGVRVLNLNELADALRPRHGAGDELTITVVREGSKPGQGVGYLEDGTMVVVEDGLALRGRTVRVAVVTSSQTALGRMIFARPKEVV